MCLYLALLKFTSLVLHQVALEHMMAKDTPAMVRCFDCDRLSFVPDQPDCLDTVNHFVSFHMTEERMRCYVTTVIMR
jgi:hypothetical protein